ncbi:KinB-signaling pathway activation protein [Alicyclobacillus cellulosilyticus]|nr:KinB-signaling pathway activation protein [Alicyclobacillus cellulosilyticus]
MRLHAFIFLLASTVAVGAATGWLITLPGTWIRVPWYVGLVAGAFLATTSLMGFWAFLTLNFVARSTLPRRVWRWLQAAITLLVLYDMLYGRYQLAAARNPAHHPSYATYFVQGAWPFVAALLAAWWKRRLSGPGSYLPTVFFLYVFTVLDWLLVIKANIPPGIVNGTGLVMMACNVYLILIYGRLLTPSSAPAPGAEPGGARAAGQGGQATMAH